MFSGIMQKPARSKGEQTQLLRACFRIVIVFENILWPAYVLNSPYKFFDLLGFDRQINSYSFDPNGANQVFDLWEYQSDRAFFG